MARKRVNADACPKKPKNSGTNICETADADDAWYVFLSVWIEQWV